MAIWTALALLLVIAGIFLSFSRGSWLAFVAAVTFMVGLTIATAPTAGFRRRAAVLSIGVAVAAAVALALLLSIGGVADFFLQRFALMQDYDAGETGRFGNQLRSLGMLLDRTNGFGPLRFRLVFGLDPHNSFINAFASYGWLGAAGFFLLVGLTLFIGFRLAVACFTVPSPCTSLLAGPAGLPAAGLADRHRSLAPRLSDAGRGMGPRDGSAALAQPALPCRGIKPRVRPRRSAGRRPLATRRS